MHNTKSLICLLLSLPTIVACTSSINSQTSSDLPTPRMSHYLTTSKYRPQFQTNKTIDAQILSATFTKINDQRGSWTGRISGNGHVALRLLIFQNNRLISSRYVGAVVLKGRPSPFRYETQLPQVPNWSWQLAFTEP